MMACMSPVWPRYGPGVPPAAPPPFLPSVASLCSPSVTNGSYKPALNTHGSACWLFDCIAVLARCPRLPAIHPAELFAIIHGSDKSGCIRN